MTSQPFADVERETLTDSSGRAVLRFVRGTRDGLTLADLVEPADGVSDDELVAACWTGFPGWAVSGPVELGRRLQARGATVMRHAHVMSRDLVAHPPEPGWAAQRPADPDLSVVPAPLDAPAYLELVEAAYPSGHPDHVPRPTDERIAEDILPLLDGSLGSLLDASRVVVESPGAGAPRLVAACLVNDYPDSGPWVTEVSRLPDPRYSGLGALLIRRAMVTLAGQGRPTLGLAVTEGNPARSTYGRLGFVEVLESLTVKVPEG